MEWIIVVIVFLVVLAVIPFKKDADKRTARIKLCEERKAALKEAAQKEFLLFKENLIERLGEPTREFVIKSKWDDWDSAVNRLFIFDNHKLIVVKGLELPYSSIYGFTLADNITSTTSSYTDGVSSSNTGNMIKRGVVGGVLGGGVGAIAGAVTSKRNIEQFSESTTTTKHNYTITIQTDNMTNPIIEIKINGQSSKVQAIIACLNIIVKNNERQ